MRKSVYSTTCFAVAVSAGLIAASPVVAAFSNQIVLVRVGDATTTFGTGDTGTYFAAGVTLDVYDFSGAFVGSHAVPSSGSLALDLTTRSDSPDGHLNFSSNGYLTFGGYRSTPGAANPSIAAATVGSNERVIGRVDSNFNIDTTTSLGTAYSTQVISAVASDNGARFWVAGGNDAAGSGGVRYVPTLGSSTSVKVNATQTGTKQDALRSIRIQNGQLIGSNTSVGGLPNRGAFVYANGNGGLPTPAADTASSVTSLLTNHEGSTTDYAGNIDGDGKGKNHPKSDSIFLDLNHNGIFDTAYSTGGKEILDKWTFDETKFSLNEPFKYWTRTASVSAYFGPEINALDYFITGTTVNVLASTDTGVLRLSDSGGIGGVVAPELFTDPQNFPGLSLFGQANFITPVSGQFRGLAVVPEPGALSCVAMFAALAMRKRRTSGSR